MNITYYTFAELARLIGCTELTIRRWCESRNYTIEKGTRGRNGYPARVALTDANMKSLIRDAIEQFKTGRGRKFRDFECSVLSQNSLVRRERLYLDSGIEYRISEAPTNYLIHNYVDSRTRRPSLTLIKSVNQYTRIVILRENDSDVVLPIEKLKDLYSFIEILNTKDEWIKASRKDVIHLEGVKLDFEGIR